MIRAPAAGRRSERILIQIKSIRGRGFAKIVYETNFVDQENINSHYAYFVIELQIKLISFRTTKFRLISRFRVTRIFARVFLAVGDMAARTDSLELTDAKRCGVPENASKRLGGPSTEEVLMSE